jgi:hypothetical protein
VAYRDEFKTYRDEVYWTIPRVLGMGFALMLGVTVLGIGACAIGLVGGAATNAAQVIQKEFYPDALLRKYEWFKDAAAALDKKQADIGVYGSRLTALSADYKGVPRAQWPRDDREQMSIWQSELSGVKASYNGLAAEYNAEMAKLNWRFTNVGDVPQGGRPLPREYRPYVEE